jgi:hypothetical protein
MAFTTALADANYALAGVGTYSTSVNSELLSTTSKSASSITIVTSYVSATTGAVTIYDYGFDAIIFGNG